MFPIWINDGSTEMPIDPIFYIVANDGMYLKKSMGHFETITKVDNISILKGCETEATLNIEKIKMRQFTQILTLFKEVFRKYKAEANIVLHYNKYTGLFKIEIPEQQVSGASVEYKNGEETYKDFLRIGTIHSHANMSAFHSATDHKDEENWDGLHITLGFMGEEYFDISCSVMANGERFMVNPEEYIEGIELVEYEVKVENYFGSNIYSYLIKSNKDIKPKKKLGYKSIAPDKDFCIPKNWLSKIKKWNFIPKETTDSKDYNSSISKSQHNLFDDLYDANDWNPCEKCPFKHHKFDMLMKDKIDKADYEISKKLGLDEFNNFSFDVDNPEHDGPTFGPLKD